MSALISRGFVLLYFVRSYLSEGTVTRPQVPPSPVDIHVKPAFYGPGNDSLRCAFDEVESDSPLLYSVLWKVDGIFLTTTTPSVNYTDFYLDQALANSIHDGSTVQCEVGVCYAGDCNITEFTKSDTYTATIGIESPDSLDLVEGEDVSVFKVTVTAPPYVLCRNRGLSDSDICSFSIKLLQPTATDELKCPCDNVIEQVTSQLVQTSNKEPVCGAMVTNENWKDAKYMLNVKATLDNKIDGDQERHLNVSVDYMVNGMVEQSNINKKAMKLNVIDRDRRALCISINDPHITTFDQTYYNLYREGEFVLYRHNTLPYSVHAMYRQCPGGASCNCAVALKIEDDVLVVDKCGPTATTATGTYPIKVKLFRNGGFHPGFKVYQYYEGRMVKAVFPTGTMVTVMRSAIPTYNLLNVWVKASAADYGKTSGLCGNFNDDPSDDLTGLDGVIDQINSTRAESFALSWRVQQSETLYTGVCPSPNTQNDALESFCFCKQNQTCGKQFDRVTCPFEINGSVDITERLLSKSLFPIKCTADVGQFQYPDFEYDPDHSEPLPSWPSAGGLSEQQAIYQCNQIQFTPSYNILKSVPGVMFEEAFQNCVQDIQITDSSLWYQTVIKNMKQRARIILPYNMSAWTMTSQTCSNPGPPKEILGQLCLADCGNAGICSDGVCTCNPGYLGLDCGISDTDIPKILFIDGNGLCDIRTSTCDVINLFTSKTMNTDTLSCYFTKLEATGNSFQLTTQTVRVGATFVTYNELECIPPSKGSYQIKISNNNIGEKVSDPANYLLYDALCFTCDVKTLKCSEKTSACLINNVCYEPGEYNPDNIHQFCDPTINYTQWQMARATSTAFGLSQIQRKYQVLELEKGEKQKLVVEISSSKQNHPISVITPNGQSYVQVYNDCHMTGRIKDVPGSYVSLETCGDASGLVINGSMLYIVKNGKIKSKQEFKFSKNSPMQCGHTKSDTGRDVEVKTEFKRHDRHRRSTEERLIIELYIVMDNELFSKPGIDRDVGKAVRYIEKVNQLTDEIFSTLNVRVLLVGIEILNATEPALPSSNSELLLTQFVDFVESTVRQRAPVDYDFAALISGKVFENNRVGLATVNNMCNSRSGCIVQDWGSGQTRELQAAVTLAHEIGHLFGMLHNDAACSCIASSCVMDETALNMPTKFTDCSARTIKEVRDTGSAPCLYNIPKFVYNGPVCGNGIKEDGEVCDCGTVQQCMKSKCCTSNCQLKDGAKCASGECCEDCQIVKANKLCRKEQNECDIEEVCDGHNGECPANLYKQDMTSCGTETFLGYCYKGQCRSENEQCHKIWGSTGGPAHSICYGLNTHGTAKGNCGSITETTYQKCNASDTGCGLLWCDSPNRYPEYGGGFQVVSVSTLNIPSLGSIVCKGTTIDLGPDVPNPGLVEDGTPCTRNAALGDNGVCINRKCKDINTMNIPSCPTDNNGTICHGNGVCNNLAKCWCFHGFTGHNCAKRITCSTSKPHLNHVHIILAVFGALFLVGLAFVVLIIYHKIGHKRKVHGLKLTEQIKTEEAWNTEKEE